MEEKELLDKVEESTEDIEQDRMLTGLGVRKTGHMEREDEKEWQNLKSQLLVLETKLFLELKNLQEKISELQERVQSTVPLQVVETTIPIIPKPERKSEAERKSILAKIWNG